MSLTLSPARKSPSKPSSIRPSLLLAPVGSPSASQSIAAAASRPGNPWKAVAWSAAATVPQPAAPLTAAPAPATSSSVHLQSDHVGLGKLTDKWIGLGPVIRSAVALFGEVLDRVPPIVVHGVPCCGKTGIVVDLLQSLRLPHIFLLCPTILSTRSLYETILSAVAAVHPEQTASKRRAKSDGAPDSDGDSTDDETRGPGAATLRVRHDKFSDFVARMKDAWTRPETLYLVFDSADRLGQLHPRLIRNLVSIAALTGRNLCPVFTCTSPSSLLLGSHEWTDVAPVLLQLPSPSQETVFTILKRRFGNTPQVSGFLQHVWGIVGGTCGPNLRELCYLTTVLLPVYTAHGASSSVFKAAMSAANDALFARDLVVTQDKVGVINRGVELELPYLSKFLLLAAYCASHNPSDTDARYFSRAAGKGIKGRRVGKGKRKRGGDPGSDLAHSEPRTFPLERLLAIFNSLLAANDGSCAVSDVLSADIFSEVTTLVALRLLSRESAAGELEAAKYKCCFGASTAFAVANRLKVKLSAVLHEPELHAQ